MQKSEKFLWEHYYQKDELKLNIPNLSIYDYMMKHSKEFKNKYAINYFGRKITYKLFWDYIEKCAKSLKAMGIKKGDVVTICLPNTPEAIITFFAINKIGGVVEMIHPLSSEVEIKDYLNSTNSKLLIALNQCYKRFKNIIKMTKVTNVIISSPSDSMPLFLNAMYNVTVNRKEELPSKNSFYLFWKDFINLGNSYKGETKEKVGANDRALILHSGGTTGSPKSIVLKNRSVTGVNEQAKVFFPDVRIGDTLLLVIPMFHCLGLVVGVFIPLCRGASVICVPQFDAKRFDKLLGKYHPNFLLGVPTLFEALVNNKHLANANLSYLKCLVCGGDSLTEEKNNLINDYLSSHHSKAKIIQGYGMTETCGPAIYGTKGSNKSGSLGIPLPGNIVRIINPDTNKECQVKEIGEIWISSDIVMEGYLNDPKTTKEVLKTYGDGRKYIATGDLGYIDEDGVIFYVQRIKRIIISSGYNIYPEYVERILKKNEYIKDVCVVGVPHPYKKEIAKAFIILKDNVEETYTVKKEIMDYAKTNLAHYMIPREYIYKKEFPKTKMAKTDYRALRDELINR